MKALMVLGTASNSGKSWLATALCTWLKRKGIRVAPFKAQNMSNNSYVTWDGGEIGRAQAVQAEACGLLPQVEMNPILLKPSGELGSQLILMGKPQKHIQARSYYAEIEKLWPVVKGAMGYWQSRCEVLVVEGAGSPVELNLMDRDIANLRVIQELDGKWVLVSDIERGGVFAQIVGTWNLMPTVDQKRGLGVIINKFRGDLSLFETAEPILHQQISLPYLGVLPFQNGLHPESEDSLCIREEQNGTGETIAWIRFPHLSNSQDCQPWLKDRGVKTIWTQKAEEIAQARVIVLPGTKNTMSDLNWLKKTGLDQAIIRAAHRGAMIVGICGGYQILGQKLKDPDGCAGDVGWMDGLGLLPVETEFFQEKRVIQTTARWKEEEWPVYEIHMGQTSLMQTTMSLFKVKRENGFNEEGIRYGKIWGTYLHGLFESTKVRQAVTQLAEMKGYQAHPIPWRQQTQNLYDKMADTLETHLKMDSIARYVDA